ncbi:DUF6403 family protein [Amycolatopsis australiensis]|uniref:Uncharacterized protein n=1 Tax=Amycolatopsis australiensis TaxID=546364 RepID=A0A1K1S785_9PSEU|nr:DUF6403 family protein [Amycolatopsis australiensis]SFW79951.1 hypothetical protein SAMN04489730_4875 [Amycolatopsis australiensis]
MGWVWVVGAVVVVVAGSTAVAVPWWRDRALRRRVAWSAARAAIGSAAVSRDAAGGRDAEAEQLLARAETLAAGHGGVRAARAARDCAHRADTRWRAVTGG